jgi:hypothetical protein
MTTLNQDHNIRGKVIVHDPKQRSKEDYSLTNPFLPQFLEDYNYGGRVN